MSCLITQGWLKGCELDTGGIKTVYLTNTANITTVAPTLGSTTSGSEDLGIVTTITPVSGAGFYEFQPNKLSSNWDQEFQYNATNGTGGFLQTINLVFAKNEAAKRNQIKLMAGADLVAIVETKSGKYWLVGEDEPLEMTTAKSSTGVQLTDLSGWTITLTSAGKYPAREVTSSIVSGLIIA